MLTYSCCACLHCSARRIRKLGGGAAIGEAYARNAPITRINGMSSLIAELNDKEITDVRKCWACGKAEDAVAGGVRKLMACQRCREALYCSKDCQRSAWKEHKGSCVEYISCPAFSKDGRRDKDVRSEFAEGLHNPPNEIGPDKFERQQTMIAAGVARGDSEALAAKASLLLKLNDFDGAVPILLPLAESDHAPSQCQVRFRTAMLME